MKKPFQRYYSMLIEYLDPNTIRHLHHLWNHSSRYYHNEDHLESMLKYIENNRFKMSKDEFFDLALAAFFHDAIYKPGASNNEDLSINFLKRAMKKSKKDLDLIIKAIECTKDRKRPTDKALRLFWEADNQIFRKDWLTFLRSEKAIRNEFSFVNDNDYKKGRIEFLESNLNLFGVKGNNNIKKLINYLEDKYNK